MKEKSYDHNLLLTSSTPNEARADEQFAIILAGATDAARARTAPAWLGGARPEQFCRTSGGDFMIDQTRQRTALLFPPEETLFVVTRDHRSYYEEVLADVPRKNLIVQPQNDGSVFAVLYAALKMAKTNPSAILTFFPADFSVANAESFMARVKTAAAAVRARPDLILLGTTAEAAATDRDWIEPDPASPLSESFDVWRVRRFRHRPSFNEAQKLRRSGALWSSAVMVGTAATFLRKIRRAAPDSYAKFGAAKSRIGTPGEERAIEKAFYSNYVDTDFARDVLAKSGEKLAVISVPESKRSAAQIKQAVPRAASEMIVERPQKFRYAHSGI